jgi:hypothetical protein
MSWRIWIPITQDDRLVSWTSRAIGKTERRWMTCPAEKEVVDHRTILYGEEYCRHAIIVVEGPPDVWKVGPGAVCPLGLGISVEQKARIAKYPVRAICFDNEPDAQKRARELANELSVLPGDTYVVCLDAADPAEASDEEIHELRKEFLQ